MTKQSKTSLPRPHNPSDSMTIEEMIQKRVQAWIEKRTRDDTGLKVSATQQSENERGFNVKQELSNTVDPEKHSLVDVACSLYSAISGSGNEAYTNQFISLTAAAMINSSSEDEANRALNSFQGGMISMDPQDVIEAQLCAKLMVLHSKAMHFMNLATHQTHRKHIDNNLNNAIKCMRLHNETLEALNRYRRKGEQRVKVVHQYVQVNEGGKAMVTAEARGGAKQKKYKV